MTESISYINSIGEKLTFTKSLQSDLVFSNLGDFGDVAVSMITQKIPLSHGFMYYGSTVEERSYTFEGVIRGVDTKAVSGLRREVARIINDAYGVGTILYERDGEKYVLEGVPDGIPSFPSGFENRNHRFQKAVFSFICHDPFWKDAADREAYMRAFTEAFSMPFRFPVRFGQQASVVTIHNGGHRETPVKLELSGPSNKPRFENQTTGEFIEITRSLADNEKLIINTETGKKSVTIRRADGIEEDGFDYLEQESTFFSLKLGDNKLKYNAVSGTGKAVAKISWRQRYNTI